MEKEEFCKQLYANLDNGTDSDDDPHDIETLLRERRQKQRLQRSTTNAPARSNVVRAQNSREHASDRSPTTVRKSIEMSPPKRSLTSRLLETDELLRCTKKLRKGATLGRLERPQIFKDLVFFFIPNNDISPARRMRIKKSVEFGASHAAQWNNNVTHVIVDSDLSFTDVTKYLKIDRFPSGIALVNGSYPADCIASGTVLDAALLRFRVNGAVLPAADETPSGQEPQAVSGAAGSRGPTVDPIQTETSHAENADGQMTLSTPASPSSHPEESIHEAPEGEPTDDLDEVIKTVKRTQDFTIILSDDEEDTNVSSAGAGSRNSGGGAKTQKSGRTGAPAWQKSFTCMDKHDGETKKSSPNGHTIEVLQQMSDYYDKTADQWRCLAYRKAITALRKEKEVIATKKQALAIRGIGERLASKIEEIVWTGRLRRLEYTKLEPNDILLSQFTKIHGVGFSLASTWISQGYKSLNDIKEKVDLTPTQRISVERYEDFLQRVPRSEVEQHGEIVRQAILNADPSFQVIIGGSYRRGAADSGDIDLIITKDGASLDQINGLVVGTVIPELFERNFLKGCVADSSRSDSSKWQGASALPGNPTWRRIDLLFVPGDELGAALIYFTGNDVFNRSIRLLASKKGMRLNQRGLFADVMRGPGRLKLNEGRLLESCDEKRIFELLGVPWRPPQHRIC